MRTEKHPTCVDLYLKIKATSDGPVCFCEGGDTYILLLRKKLVVFYPKLDRYDVIFGSGYDEVVSVMCKFSDAPERLVKELRKFETFSAIRGFTLVVGAPKDADGTELLLPYDRLKFVVSAGDQFYGKKISKALFCIALVGLCWSYLLIKTGNFSRLLEPARGERKQSISASQRHRVASSILAASKYLPMGIDCKGIAATHKFVLKLTGYKCDIAIGVLNEPFMAHMWAMSESTPLGELDTAVDEFHLIYSSSWEV